MIDIDQFFLQVFGNFAVHARIIAVFWIILAGGYWLARIPRKNRTNLIDYQEATRVRLIFVALLVMVTFLFAISYAFHF